MEATARKIERGVYELITKPPRYPMRLGLLYANGGEWIAYIGKEEIGRHERFVEARKILTDFYKPKTKGK